MKDEDNNTEGGKALYGGWGIKPVYFEVLFSETRELSFWEREKDLIIAKSWGGRVAGQEDSGGHESSGWSRTYTDLYLWRLSPLLYLEIEPQASISRQSSATSMQFAKNEIAFKFRDKKKQDSVLQCVLS